MLVARLVAVQVIVRCGLGAALGKFADEDAEQQREVGEDML